MKEICFYSIASHLGGAERSLLDLVSRLEERSGGRYRPWILLPQTRGSLVEALEQNKIPFSSLKMPVTFFEMSRAKPMQAVARSLVSLPGMSVYAARLLWAIRKRSPAILHTTGIKCHALAAELRPAYRRPLVIHLRDIFKNGPVQAYFKILKGRSRAHFIANSKATAAPFGEIPVVYNGLDARIYHKAPNNELHLRFGIPPGTPIVGILGVLARWKGQVEFIKMAKRLIEAGTNAHFVIIGDEIYDTSGERGFRGVLEKQVSESGLTQRVHLAGYAKDPATALNGIDVLVHASIRPEPFGRVVIEAMAVGIPIVASALGGVLEIITDESDGLLFKADGEEPDAEMAAKVNRILMDKVLAEKLMAAGHRTFSEKFTIDRHVDRIIDIYDGITA